MVWSALLRLDPEQKSLMVFSESKKAKVKTATATRIS